MPRGPGSPSAAVKSKSPAFCPSGLRGKRAPSFRCQASAPPAPSGTTRSSLPSPSRSIQLTPGPSWLSWKSSSGWRTKSLNQRSEEQPSELQSRFGKSYAVFFFNDTATTEIYTLSLHDALPIFEIDPAHPGAELAQLEVEQRLADEVVEPGLRVLRVEPGGGVPEEGRPGGGRSEER